VDEDSEPSWRAFGYHVLLYVHVPWARGCGSETANAIIA